MKFSLIAAAALPLLAVADTTTSSSTTVATRTITVSRVISSTTTTLCQNSTSSTSSWTISYNSTSIGTAVGTGSGSWPTTTNGTFTVPVMSTSAVVSVPQSSVAQVSPSTTPSSVSHNAAPALSAMFAGGVGLAMAVVAGLL